MRLVHLEKIQKSEPEDLPIKEMQIYLTALDGT